jgi:hypothetical protein
MTLSENLMNCANDLGVIVRKLFAMLCTSSLMSTSTTPLILIKHDKIYFKQTTTEQYQMEAIIDFYIHELKSNPELSRDNREKYLDVINAYSLEMLKRM